MILLLLLLASVAASAQISTPTMYRPQIFDVQHYDAAITFPDPTKKTIVGDVSITVKWTAGASKPSFPFHLRGLTIDSVFVNDVVSSAVTLGEASSDTMHHRVTLKNDVVAGQTDIVRVFYHGVMSDEGGSSPWGGVHYQDSVLYALGVGFKNSYVSSTQHWLACYDHPSDKATFFARFTVPVTPWKLASVGREVFTREPWPNGFAIYRWSEDHPTSTYLLTFAVAPYTKIEMSGVVPHVFYTLPRDSSKSARSFILVPRMTETFAKKYGNYPFDKVGYCNTQIGAMEHQTMISFNVSIAQKADSQNVTAAHELAHQWFGDCVSPLDFRYAWLTESFATYSECVWVEELRGFPIYLRAVAEKATAYLKNISKSEGVFALENFPRVDPSSNYPQTIYAKGAVVVAMMRAIAGDEPFFSAMKRYQSVKKYGTAVTEDMRDAVRPALGTRTDAFFDEWVTGIGWPQLHVNTDITGSDHVVTITQEQQKLHPTWPIFTTLPLNVVYTRNGFAGIDTIDAVMYFDSTGTLEFTCTQLLSVNIGTKCRSLVEITKTTSVFDFYEKNEASQTFTLAPNPANDSVTLSRIDGSAAIKISIVNERGATLLTQMCAQNESQCLMDIRSLTNGAYSIIIDDGKTPRRLPLTVTRGE
ncbi:MAG: M1 family aminopeptidase [Candidatus Kapabacteria bacterium]|nr:M1 family aminopeptidase [Candidatus Kapabacteria bacterium]